MQIYGFLWKGIEITPGCLIRSWWLFRVLFFFLLKLILRRSREERIDVLLLWHDYGSWHQADQNLNDDWQFIFTLRRCKFALSFLLSFRICCDLSALLSLEIFSSVPYFFFFCEKSIFSSESFWRNTLRISSYAACSAIGKSLRREVSLKRSHNRRVL